VAVNPPGSFFASVDIQPARGTRNLQGIDPGFQLPPTNICGHFLRKAPFYCALSKCHSVVLPRYARGVVQEYSMVMVSQWTEKYLDSIGSLIGVHDAVVERAPNSSTASPR